MIIQLAVVKALTEHYFQKQVIVNDANNATRMKYNAAEAYNLTNSSIFLYN